MDIQNNGLDTYIDVDDALKRVGGNIDLYKKLLGVFSGGNNIQPIADAIEAGNITEAAQAVHALKGVSANLSLTKVHSVSAELEAKLKNGLDFSDCFEQLKTVLKDTLDRVSLV